MPIPPKLPPKLPPKVPVGAPLTRGPTTSVATGAIQPRPEAETAEPVVYRHGSVLLGAPAPSREAFLQIAERLEPAVQVQVQAALALAPQLEGDKPSDTKVNLVLRIAGKQARVCTNCGNPACNNYAAMYRAKPPDIDLLQDSLYVFSKMAEALGIQYGVVLVDDKDVLVLRETAPSKVGDDAGTMLARFGAFRDRHEYPDPTNGAWLKDQLAKWDPSDRDRSAIGEADDRRALRTALTQLANAPGKKGALLYATSEQPTQRLSEVEREADAQGVSTLAIAMGKHADRIARGLFSSTVSVADAHGVRDQLAAHLEKLLDKPGD